MTTTCEYPIGCTPTSTPTDSGSHVSVPSSPPPGELAITGGDVLGTSIALAAAIVAGSALVWLTRTRNR